VRAIFPRSGSPRARDWANFAAWLAVTLGGIGGSKGRRRPDRGPRRGGGAQHGVGLRGIAGPKCAVAEFPH
jgi:hypothetical protein